ncbi:unnamed protein product [Mytilus edulis]|uniref:Ankyrin repeat protein n=1 Tax=Mytilus edulis TaxID=6550 RepID=A0A8S3RMT9_MYTED|nr:unnamed protein product [Mytilus edulis]
MREAVRSVCVVEKMELLECFLYNIDHSLYDVHHVLKDSCRYGWTHIVKWLLDNTEHSSLDISSAMHTVLHREFVGPDNTLVGLLLQYPIHDKVDVAEIIKECCWWGLLNLVQLICEKNDHKKLDMKEAMNTACSRSHFDLVDWMLANIENNLFDMPTAFDKAIHADFDDLNASLILLLKDYTDHKLIDMKHLLTIGCKQCWYNIVDWVLGNADHTVLDVDKAMNSVYIKWMFDEPFNDDIEINCRRVKYEPLIKMILEKVNHSLLDLKEVFNQACHYASLDVVILVLENTDHKKIYVKKALDILYISWMYDDNFDELGINERRDKYEPLIKLMIEKENFDSLDLKKVLNQACQYGSFDIVKLVLENTDHERLDVNEAMKKAYDSWMYSDKKCIDGRNRYEPVMKLILEKVNHNSLYLQNILIQACKIGSLDVLTLVLEKNDHNKLDVKAAMNILHDELNNFKYYYGYMNFDFYEEHKDRSDRNKKNTDHKLLDVKKATSILYDAWEWNYYYSTIEEIKDMRDQYEKLIKLIIEKVKHDSLDLQILLNLAFCCCSLDAVTLMLEKTDHKMLNVQKAIDIICYQWENSDIRDKYEQLINLILAKVNDDSLDLHQVLDCACFYHSLDFVTLLLEKTDHKQLHVKEVMNIICNEWDFDKNSDRRDKHERKIKLILEKVNRDSLDLQNVLNHACRWTLLDVVTLLLENTDHKLLDVKKAMNIICQHWDHYYYEEDEENSAREEKLEQLIILILDKVNHDSLDLQQVFDCVCRYCSLDVVTLLLEKTDHKMLDVQEALKIKYEQYLDKENIDERDNTCNNKVLIELIFEKVNHDYLDLKIVLFLACIYGSIDVITLLLEKQIITN